jgi:two-component system heavy metal sensor histidine kinase CusS
MFSKRTEPRSIASQLVLLFTLAAALLLLCGLGVLYWIVVRHAFEEDNAVLADKVAALQMDFEKRGGVDALTAEINGADRSEHASFRVRVLDPAGATIMHTPGMKTLLPANIFPAAAAPEVAVPTEYRSGGRLFALTSRQALSNGQLFTIQVAQDRSEDERFMKQFGALLVVVLATGVVASALIAARVTRRGLRPLAQMTESVQRISPAHLDERVGSMRWPKELQPLAAAFDEMLGRLHDSFTRLSQFSADLAHELRTPVANILGESQVTLTRARTLEDYRQVIESNVAECERLSGIIDKLLFLARAEAEEERVQRTIFDGADAIAKIAAFYETVAEEQQVAITCSGAGKIHADAVLFGHALSNLIENALRFTPAGGKIDIVLTDRDAQSEISVSDTGSGFAAEHIPRVFDRFYRTDPSRSSSGSGLGLALVKSIVDLHRGAAVAQSEIGRGTTVTLTFPKTETKRS